MRKLIKKHAEKIRFGVVGVANTAIDFAILFVLVLLGLDKTISNFISTSVALTFSFVANKKFAFKSNNKSTRRDIIKFLSITLVGLWVIQPIIINSLDYITKPLNIDPLIILFFSKCLATSITMIWNYLLYRKFVFNKGQ